MLLSGKPCFLKEAIQKRRAIVESSPPETPKTIFSIPILLRRTFIASSCKAKRDERYFSIVSFEGCIKEIKGKVEIGLLRSFIFAKSFSLSDTISSMLESSILEDKNSTSTSAYEKPSSNTE